MPEFVTMLWNYKNFFLMLLLLVTATSEYNGCNKSPVELSNIENASVIIGGMFPVHYWDKISNKYLLNKPGLLWIEAMIFAIDEINKNNDLLQNKKLGYRIQDSCNDINIAIESALELTQGFAQYTEVSDGMCSCNSNVSRAVALVGDAASATSTNVAAILSSTKTTQISYSATSTDLNAKQLYPSFLRTIPPDNVQAVLIADLIVHNNWTYVNVIACDDEYGRVGFNELLPRLKDADVCIAFQEIYDVKGDTSENKTKKIIEKLLLEKQANVIVLWCQRPEAIRVLRIAESMRLHNKTWIATETYGITNDVYDIDPNVVRGMFGVIPLQVTYEPFENRLKSINPNLEYKNPWIEEYWKERKCDTSNRANCSNIDLSELPRSKYAEVIHAVQSIARGLNSYIESENPLIIEPQRLFSYVKNVTFFGINNLSVSYDEKGNPRAASYSVTNLKQDSNTNSTWNVVASWDFLSRKIVFTSNNPIIYAGSSKETPYSSCKEKCKPGFYGLSFEKSCCWECVKCGDDSIQPNYGQSNCTRCTENKRANKNRTICVQPKQVYISPDSQEGIFLIILSTIGFVLVFFSIVLFYKYKETPIVKASNRNLSLLQLVSILCIFLLPSFCIQKETTKYICGGQLLYFVCFNSIAVSVTFTKADRLLRVFNNSKSGRLTKNSVVKTNKVQFLTVAALTFIGIVLCIVSFFSFPIQVSFKLEREEDDGIEITCYCDGYYNSILFLMIGYVAVIALVCGVYAFKARNIPETHNEARLTSFAMFVFLLSWLMFIPIYLSTNDQHQKLAIWCFVSYTSTICFFLIMYVPKLYFIIFKAEENTKTRFRAKITQSTFVNVANELEMHNS